MSKTVILLNPMGTDVTPFVNGSLPGLQLLRGSIMQAGDTLYTLPYNNTSGIENIQHGVDLLDAKLRATSGQVLVFGYSEGGQVADKWLTDHGQSAPVSTTDVSFLLIGNACRKYGGFIYQQSGFSSLGYTQGRPQNTPYKVVDFCRQYDPIADFPQAPAIQEAMASIGDITTNLTVNTFLDVVTKVWGVLTADQSVQLAAENALVGAELIHDWYMNVEVTDVENLSFTEGNSTYVWAPTYPLPMLGVATFPSLDQQYRQQIETWYPRPVNIPFPDYSKMSAGLGSNVIWTQAEPPSTLAVLDMIEQQANDVRAKNNAIRKAKPLIRLWMNNPDGSEGLVYVGRVDYDDTIKGSFPFKNNTPTQGILELRDDHYISMWLKALPNDPSLKKNVVITVDFYGGKKRWSGMLDKWTIKSKNYVKTLEVTFNDDLTMLQYLLCPPNPYLPIPVFQFPRVFTLGGPAKWCISSIILLNLMRVEGNWWTLPDDPFDLTQWVDQFDWSTWQCLVKADPFLLDDSSLWTFLSSRMNPIDSVIADSLDDAQLTITYKRIITDDGEQSDVPGVPHVKNGVLVFEVVDNSNATAAEGTFWQGTIVDGFVRSVMTYGGGFVEDTLNVLADDQTLQPDEYYQTGWLATMAQMPWLVIRDNEWTPIESSELSWGPAKNVSVVVGGDNPAADAIAKLIIETTGNLLGYFLLGGFSSAGTIASDIIMPFIVGTIAAWLQWKNTGRATDLGWVHYWELYQQGGESNAWSLSALTALRGGFLVGRAETHHIMALHDSWVIPGVHIDIGQRMGSTLNSKGVENIIWVNQLEEMTCGWDHSNNTPIQWVLKVGKSDRAMSLGERYARLAKKMSDALNNVGVHLVQS